MKEIKVAVAAPVRYTVQDPETGDEVLSFTMLGDAPGIMRWLVPARVSKDGMPVAAPLSEDTFDEFLSCIVAPGDAAAVAAAIEDGTFTDKARFDAATHGWANAQFLTVRNLAGEVLALTAQLSTLTERISDGEDGGPLGQG